MHLKKTPKLENDLELQVKLSKKSTKVHFAVSLCGPNHERYCSECLFARDSSYTRPPSSPAALRKLPCLDTSLTLTEHAGPTFFPGLSSPSGSYRGTTMHSTATLPLLSCYIKSLGF